jgi:hypothetical protein
VAAFVTILAVTVDPALRAARLAESGFIPAISHRQATKRPRCLDL